MAIEVLKQYDLACRYRVPVVNVKQALEHVKRLMGVKRVRKMRLRYIDDHPNRQLVLEGGFEQTKIALRALREGGFVDHTRSVRQV